MLKIHFGPLEGSIEHPGTLFNNTFKPEWFEDPFVRYICKVVDKTEVASAYQMTNPIFGPVNCRLLSTGCKNCILAYKTDRIINATLMGDNCGSILLEISETKDLTITLEHTFNFSGVERFTAYIINSEKMVYSYSEYLDEAIEYL